MKRIRLKPRRVQPVTLEVAMSPFATTDRDHEIMKVETGQGLRTVDGRELEGHVIGRVDPYEYLNKRVMRRLGAFVGTLPNRHYPHQKDLALLSWLLGKSYAIGKADITDVIPESCYDLYRQFTGSKSVGKANAMRMHQSLALLGETGFWVHPVKDKTMGKPKFFSPPLEALFYPDNPLKVAYLFIDAIWMRALEQQRVFADVNVLWHTPTVVSANLYLRLRQFPNRLELTRRTTPFLHSLGLSRRQVSSNPARSREVLHRAVDDLNDTLSDHGTTRNEVIDVEVDSSKRETLLSWDRRNEEE